jgi:hypothetical protein
VNLKAAWNVGGSFFLSKYAKSRARDIYNYMLGMIIFCLSEETSESCVIKNFSKQVSQLLTLRSLNALYSYTAPLRCKLGLQGFFDETYFISRPHNKRDTEAISFDNAFALC